MATAEARSVCVGARRAARANIRAFARTILETRVSKKNQNPRYRALLHRTRHPARSMHHGKERVVAVYAAGRASTKRQVAERARLKLRTGRS